MLLGHSSPGTSSRLTPLGLPRYRIRRDDVALERERIGAARGRAPVTTVGLVPVVYRRADVARAPPMTAETSPPRALLHEPAKPDVRLPALEERVLEKWDAEHTFE